MVTMVTMVTMVLFKMISRTRKYVSSIVTISLMFIFMTVMLATWCVLLQVTSFGC